MLNNAPMYKKRHTVAKNIFQLNGFPFYFLKYDRKTSTPRPPIAAPMAPPIASRVSVWKPHRMIAKHMNAVTNVNIKKEKNLFIAGVQLQYAG